MRESSCMSCHGFGIKTQLFVSFSPHTMSLYIDMKILRPGKCSGSHDISVIMFWISARICNVVNPGKLVHSNSIGSPSIRSNSRHWDEFTNHSIFSFQALVGSYSSCPYTTLSRRIHRFLLWKTDKLCKLKSSPLPRTLEPVDHRKTLNFFFHL